MQTLSTFFSYKGKLRFAFVFFGFALLACNQKEAHTQNAPSTPEAPPPNYVLPEGKTIATRFAVPEGFVRVKTEENSFTAYLQHFPLQPDGSPVLFFNGKENTQSSHLAVLDISVGKRDLQQCADAVMRLRAEYLFGQKRYDEIHFNFVSGFNAEYARWRKGERIRIVNNGQKAVWGSGGEVGDSRASFKKYLNMVFSFAGTASLVHELEKVEDQPQIGDVLIQGGSPGHAVIILDAIENPNTGERRYLMAQSYMPAQSIHVLQNTNLEGKTPWFTFPEDPQGEILTPSWLFFRQDLGRF